MHWPASKVIGGSITQEIGHIIDLMPTFLDVADVRYSSTGSNRRRHPLPGSSLVPIFEGDELPDRTIFWEHEGNRAVRRGKWKLVSEFPGTWSSFYSYQKNAQWELYDMSVDRGEQHDLAQTKPELVRELSGEYKLWAETTQIVSWDKLSGRQE